MSEAQICWIYCHKETGRPFLSPTYGKIMVHSIRPTQSMIDTYGYTRRGTAIARPVLMTFLDEVNFELTEGIVKIKPMEGWKNHDR